eukprot:CAMPEP_0119298946 /NCGR_PEP_ID=MMETSP1333-20130426/1034_1 /TAXON_ID=418940 /ORGANISM="Scyphosphaera apsteinii, Strain RCC1455" /LENGTH=55 /DNA_ID=CAMNT_0007300201 /DNA_START=55 /DNA_END=222 /DNA_ORIENTATION=-
MSLQSSLPCTPSCFNIFEVFDGVRQQLDSRLRVSESRSTVLDMGGQVGGRVCMDG